MKRIDDAVLASLENKAKLVDSEFFENLIYAIDREGKGMWVIIDRKTVIPICEPETFAKEMFEIWNHLKPKGA